MKSPFNNRILFPGMNYLLQRVLDQNSAPDSNENRTRIGMLEGWVSTIISLGLCLVKGWLGLVSGSISLIADAVNNFTDMGSSLVIALSFQWSRKPSDEEHPFGHGRIETIATLVLSLALLLVGFEVAKSGVYRLLDPQVIEAPGWLMVLVGVTIIVKLWMAIFARKLAKLSKSHVLEADAWNHIFDVASTLLVILALVCSRMGWGGVDGWTAIGVAAFILYTGYKYAREAIDILLGTTPSAEEMANIYSIIESVDGVLSVHEVVVHQYGDVKMVSFHIEVDAAITVLKAHAIANDAEEAVKEQMQWRAVVHVDPVDRSHPSFEPMYEHLKQFVAQDHEIVDFHDLRISGDAPPYSISFDFVTEVYIKQDKYAAIYKRTMEALSSQFENQIGQIEVGIEAAVDSQPMHREQFNLAVDSAST